MEKKTCLLSSLSAFRLPTSRLRHPSPTLPPMPSDPRPPKTPGKRPPGSTFHPLRPGPGIRQDRDTAQAVAYYDRCALAADPGLLLRLLPQGPRPSRPHTTSPRQPLPCTPVSPPRKKPPTPTPSPNSPPSWMNWKTDRDHPLRRRLRPRHHALDPGQVHALGLHHHRPPPRR